MKIDTHNPSPPNCYQLYRLSSILVSNELLKEDTFNFQTCCICSVRVQSNMEVIECVVKGTMSVGLL